jgi:DNA-directed RNA polymerase I and III subunit RPAC1
MDLATLTEATVLNVGFTQTHTQQPPSFQDMLSALQVKVVSNTFDQVELEVIGLDAPIANALRRILLAEVPSMAIEHVYLDQNTSVIPDEVLAHRLGLIPIKVDPRRFKFRKGEEVHDDSNSLTFRLHAKCPLDKPVLTVYSGDLQWEPVGDQNFTLSNVRPVHEDIIIAKLGPGQEIEAELVCEKGVGSTHAKWSPVCTASYRLMPAISLKTELTGEAAEALVSCCPVRVFDIEDSAVKVSRARDCTSCRECIRLHSEAVSLNKVKNHFICEA